MAVSDMVVVVVVVSDVVVVVVVVETPLLLPNDHAAVVISRHAEFGRGARNVLQVRTREEPFGAEVRFRPRAFDARFRGYEDGAAIFRPDAEARCRTA